MPTRIDALACVVVLVLAVSPSAQALWIGATAEPIPLERIRENTVAYLKEHPDDARTHYNLGRLYYLALTRGTTEFRVELSPDHDRPLDVLHDLNPLPLVAMSGAAVGNPEAGEFVRHVLAAATYLHKAIELEPQNGLYHLTWASFMQQLAETGKSYAMPVAPDGTRPKRRLYVWDEEKMLQAAFQGYKLAFSLSLVVDADLDHTLGLSYLVSHEAALRLIALSERDAAYALTPHLRALLDLHLNLLKEKPLAITPIIIGNTVDSDIDALLDPERVVSFDLDGSGLTRRWTWLRPDTAVLVWDPMATGDIRSGRQLFGNVTWWMFWTDGYHTLTTLDDDHDGWLRGEELAGIRIWRDADSDGVSDDGEVVDLDALGIVGLCTEPDETTARGEWMHPQGVEFTDGSHVPSFDWVAESVPAE